jgi:hypothetical protein
VISTLFLRHSGKGRPDFEAMLGVKHLMTAMTASGFGRALSMKRLTMTVARLEHDPEKWKPVSEKIMLKLRI